MSAIALAAVLVASSGASAHLETAGGGRPASALEVLNRALYGAPADVPLASLLDTPAEYEGRAVTTRGRFGRSPDRAYGLSTGTRGVRLQPEPGLAARVRARAGSWEGKEIALTGVFVRDVARASGDGRREEPRFLIRFWGVNAPPPAGAADAEGAPVSLEQLVYGRVPAGGGPLRVLGKFRGLNLFGDLPWATRRNDTDWVIKDDFFAVWVTGKAPEGDGFRLDPQSRSDTESWVEVVGRAQTRNGITYLRAERVLLADVSSGAALARAPAAVQSHREPAVVFTLPVPGDGLVPDAPIVIQFNKHMDEVSFAGRVRLHYADAPGGLSVPRLLYEDTNRALVVDPVEPLAAGRELVLELLEGIVDVDGQALRAQGAPPAAGVVESVRYRVEG